ncbi:hypothetical protein ACFYUV_41710 [Nonomuraea sp. NPDC003560]
MAALKPGLVLVHGYADRRSPVDWVDMTITREQFDRQGQDPADRE